MSRLFARICVAGGVLTAVLVVLAPRATFLVVGVSLSLLALFATGAALWALRDHVLYARAHRPAQAPLPVDEVSHAFDRLRRQVELGTSSPTDLQLFVQPTLVQVTSRLLLRHGIEVAADPVPTLRLLGPDLSTMVGASDVDEPEVREQDPRARLASALSTLESL